MSIVRDLDTATDWLREIICSGWHLKPRSLEDEQDTEEWEYRLVEPAVFALQAPVRKRLPPEVEATTPAICVQLIDGDDRLYEQQRHLNLRLSFCVWDPGLHGPDILKPKTSGQSDSEDAEGTETEDAAPGDTESGMPGDQESEDEDAAGPNSGDLPQKYVPGDPGTFVPTNDGWRDVWNFVDRTLRIIESAEAIGCVSLDRAQGIKFGSFDEQEKPPQYWAYWQAWAELTLIESIIRSRPQIDQYL